MRRRGGERRNHTFRRKKTIAFAFGERGIITVLPKYFTKEISKR